MAAANVLGALTIGYIFTTSAPSDARWILWIYVTAFYATTLSICLLVARYLRRHGIIVAEGAETPVRARRWNRSAIYTTAAAVIALSATDQARSVAFRRTFNATTKGIFFWNLMSFVLLVIIVEFGGWRRRH